MLEFLIHSLRDSASSNEGYRLRNGGSGGIGQALLEQLVELYEVKCLFRTKSAVTGKWEQRGCTAVWGDLDDDKALVELVKGARFVFHCAALVASGSYKKAYPVNVQGTLRLAQTAAAQGCQRLIHTSSIAVYSGASGDEDYHEATELRDSDDMAVYSRTKVQAEQAFQKVGQGRRLEYTILRPTCGYDPQTKSYTLIPIELIRKGLEPLGQLEASEQIQPHH